MLLDITVTVADITSLTTVAIDNKSTPNSTRVAQIIEEAKAVVTGEAGMIGIPADIDETTDPIGFNYLKKAIIYLAMSDILLARDRGMDNASGYYTRYKDMMKQLRTRATSVSPVSSTGVTNTVVITPVNDTFDAFGGARRFSYRSSRR
jgi:hypothetical protein